MASWWDKAVTGFQSKDGANALIGLGTGLLSQPTFAQGLAAGGQGFMQGAQLDQEYEAERRRTGAAGKYAEIIEGWGPEYTDFATGIREGAFDPADGYYKALEYKRETTQSQQELERARANAQFIQDPELRGMVEAGAMSFADAYKYQTQGGAGSRDIALQPQWAIDPATQQPVLGQLADDGSFVPTDMGGLQPMDPRQLNTERAFGTNFGGTQGEMAANRPAAQVKAESALGTLEQKNAIAINAIDTAIQQASGWNTGNVMGNSGWVPGIGQGALDLGKTLDTIKANIGFEELQTMRDNSPTGGALGSITERELAFLQSTIASIEQSQSETQLEQNLTTLRDFLASSAERRRMAYEQQFGGNNSGPAPIGGGPAPAGAPTAINPATGERVVFDGQQWVPAQ